MPKSDEKFNKLWMALKQVHFDGGLKNVLVWLSNTGQGNIYIFPDVVTWEVYVENLIINLLHEILLLTATKSEIIILHNNRTLLTTSAQAK